MRTKLLMNLKSLSTVSLLVAGLIMSTAATAQNYALIMGIGDYSDPGAHLNGIDIDENNAHTIANIMGIPASNQTLINDKGLSKDDVQKEFNKLSGKIDRGDNVFIYYSGHGTQFKAKNSGAKCTEGMVTYDMKVFEDFAIEQSLSDLSEKAGKIVFMNDSCFSGGQASSKSLPRGLGKRQPKIWKFPSSAAETPNYVCGDAINMKLSRQLIPMAKEKGSNLLYIAASQDNEVATATSNGSAATLAWLTCIKPSSDSNRSGSLTGEEIRKCAQGYLDDKSFDQHITLVGNRDLPLFFASTSSDLVNSGTAATVLEDIRNSASPEFDVSLKPLKSKLKIGKDSLDFTVASKKSGYLSILQVSQDGNVFNQIFPNDYDQDNRIQSGTFELPHSSWTLKSGGPLGISYLLAIVSENKKNFAKGMKSVGPFKSGNSFRTLVVEATGNNKSQPGRYGASFVIPIEEY